MNFPSQLAIRASDPRAALAHFAGSESATDSELRITDYEWLISLQSTDIKSYGIAGRIWEAAYFMNLYLQPPCTWEFEPQCSISRDNGAIVELGSGNGFLGLRLARSLSLRADASKNISKSLILTDLEVVCPLLRRNASQVLGVISGVDLIVRPLEWGNLEHGKMLATELMARQFVGHGTPLLSHILCSDLIYFPELLPPLLCTLLQLSSPPFASTAHPVEVIISYVIRSLTKECPFWSAFGTWFNFAPVLCRRKSDPPEHWERFGSHNDGAAFIFIATRKPESLGWPIPSGSDIIKGHDETFETLLLMNMAAT